MADTREFSSSMSAPQSGNANLNITANGTTTNYNPFGPDRQIDIQGGDAELEITVNGVTDTYKPSGQNKSITISTNTDDIFIDSPVAIEHKSADETYDDGADGQAKYTKCMTVLGNGALPVCTARNHTVGSHGLFAPLSYITDNCELVFNFIGKSDGLSETILRLNSNGVWYKIK